MDKYEYQLKLDQINKLVDRNDYATAMKIANNIDWRRVRSVNTLSKIAEVYEMNGEYEESRDLLVMAYERAPVGRMIAYRLSDLSVKLGDYDQAIEYYKDFVHSSPKDPAKLLLKYKIYRGKGAALSDQIAILEEYRSLEYEEEWALELAYLYQEAGDIARCVNECDELILWFNDGHHVLKAMELKMQYAELTPAQLEKYELRMNRTKLVDARDGVKNSRAAAQGQQDPQIYNMAYEQGYNQMYGYDQGYMQGYEQGYDPNYQEPYYGGYDQNGYAYQGEELPQIQDPELVMKEEALTIEDDGQMRLEMPVYQPVEKQITGQMTIQEILAEWEKVKEEEVSAQAEVPAAEPEAEAEQPEETPVYGAPAVTIVEEEMPEEMPVFDMDFDLPEIAMPEGFEEAEESVAEEAAEEIPAESAVEEVAEEIATESAVEEAAEEIAAESAIEEVAEEIPAVESVYEEIEEEIPAENLAVEEAVEEIPAVESVYEEIAEEIPAESAFEEMQEEILEELPEISMDFDLPEIQDPVYEEEEEDEGDDAAEDLEAKIIRSFSRESLALADAEDGSIDGRIGDEDIRIAAPRHRREVSQGTLTEEQQKIFSYFTPVHGMSDQLWAALEKEKHVDRSGSSMTGNIMIRGEAGTGKTMLAVNLVKAIQKAKNQNAGRLAKISAETLNEKDVTAVVRKLNGGALIVERASELTNESAIRLEMAMRGQTGGLLFIFEDEKQALKRFMKLHPRLAETFTTKIDIPIFSNDELVEFGKCYAYELEYSIDEMAVLALYNRIGNMQRDDYDVSVTDVKKIIDAAIEKSERGGIGKFFSSFSKKRYDDDDCIILREKDFEE